MNFYESIFTRFLSGFSILILFLIILIIIISIVGVIASWKLFEKAGRKGWESIIPIYNSWVLVEIAGLNWWWFLLAVINFVFKVEFDGFGLSFDICGFLASFNIYYNIARKFGKNNNTSVFCGLFSYIFILIFGFSKNEVFDANISVSANGIFGTNDVESAESVDKNINNHSICYCGNCGTKLNKDIKYCPNCGKENLYNKF